jgi:hypothetical protein
VQAAKAGGMAAIAVARADDAGMLAGASADIVVPAGPLRADALRTRLGLAHTVARSAAVPPQAFKQPR